MSTDRILRRREVQARTGLSRSSLYAALAAGNFPRQVALGPRSVGWLESEITAWINARCKERDAEHNE